MPADTKLKKLKRALMIAIITNDLRHFLESIDESRRTASGTKRLKTLLLTRQMFLRDLFPAVPQATKYMFRRSLLDITLIQPVSVQILPFLARLLEQVPLEDCLEGYRGYLIHVAAVLNRAEIVEAMLLEVERFGWDVGKIRSPAIQRLLTVRDSEGHSALMAAVIGGGSQTIAKILCIAVSYMSRHHARSIIREAVTASTFSVLTRPEVKDSVRELLSMTDGYYQLRHVRLYWPILCCREDLVKRSVQELEGLRVPGGPHALHAAVWLYSQDGLTPERRGVLDYLLSCDNELPLTFQRADINDVCCLTLRSDPSGPMSGTAVHFALYRLSAPYTQFWTPLPRQQAFGCLPGNSQSSLKSAQTHPDRQVQTIITDPAEQVRANSNDQLKLCDESGQTNSKQTGIKTKANSDHHDKPEAESAEPLETSETEADIADEELTQTKSNQLGEYIGSVLKYVEDIQPDLKELETIEKRSKQTVEQTQTDSERPEHTEADYKKLVQHAASVPVQLDDGQSGVVTHSKVAEEIRLEEIKADWEKHVRTEAGCWKELEQPEADWNKYATNETESKKQSKAYSTELEQTEEGGLKKHKNTKTDSNEIKREALTKEYEKADCESKEPHKATDSKEREPKEGPKELEQIKAESKEHETIEANTKELQINKICSKEAEETGGDSGETEDFHSEQFNTETLEPISPKTRETEQSTWTLLHEEPQTGFQDKAWQEEDLQIEKAYAQCSLEAVLEILESLHKKGADFCKMNKEGKTPLDLLTADADPRLVYRLIQYMRDN